ncbi:hypothetical protein FisN_3Lh383 [Fistulifera solaris]|uniref:Uncharacterized protein n=1 Tax=Fistulifera solaris TaxID=1519565 RepID=A0A1Z5J8P7_FISSO|nr:hypothetical protein FisN_3Lh383 [Fistulifera solaris]|eukprot:GAX10188.1 hypothetical protein FisN_3Lh383 [Fistulifera solaris]
MVPLMSNIFNHIKSECEPDEQLSSVSTKTTPGRARVDNSDTDCHSSDILVDVQSSSHVSEIGKTEAQEEASHATDERHPDTQSSLPDFEYLTNDGFFDHNEPLPEDTTKETNYDNPVAVLYKKKIFNSSFICAKRVAKLTPSDRSRLCALVKLKADDLQKAMLHVNIPPFPTPAEMAEKLAMKRTSPRKRSSDIVSRPKQPSKRRGSFLPSSSTQYVQKIAPKVSWTEVQEPIPATTTRT